MKNRPFHERLGFALAGIRQCWRSERSFRTQSVIAAMAMAVLVIWRPAPAWWAITLLASALVMALEALNAALERLIDHIHPAMHPEIGAAKDMAAGAVLLSGFSALAVGACMMISAMP